MIARNKALILTGQFIERVNSTEAQYVALVHALHAYTGPNIRCYFFLETGLNKWELFYYLSTRKFNIHKIRYSFCMERAPV